MIVAIGSIRREAAGIIRSREYTAVKAAEDFAAYQPKSEEYPTIVLSGSGSERAARATKWAIQEFSPEAIVSFGFCAATKNYARPGDIVIAASVIKLPGSPFEWSIEDEMNSLGPDKTMLLACRTAVEISGLDFHHGTIVTIEKVATTSGAKKWLGDAVNATATDTASHAIATTASAACIPWAVVCSVIDGRDVNSPKVIDRIGLGPNQRGNMAYIKHVSSTPQDLLALMRLGRSATSANSSLNTFIKAFMQAHSGLTKAQQSATSE
jgi:nucleoside phosphorylase